MFANKETLVQELREKLPDFSVTTIVVARDCFLKVGSYLQFAPRDNPFNLLAHLLIDQTLMETSTAGEIIGFVQKGYRRAQHRYGGLNGRKTN